jgi:CRP/FNR family cyclic AMP-dependent transcriptional regulator
MVVAMMAEELLARHHLLGSLEPVEAREVRRLAQTRRVRAEQTIFRRGDPGDGLYGVLSGRVVVTAESAAGKEIILNMFGPGEFFGEIALLDGKGRSASAVAKEPSELVFLSRRLFLLLIERRPHVAIHMIALLCEKLRRTTELVEDSMFLNVASRLAKRLGGLAQQYGRPAEAPGATLLAISQGELAQTLGVSREIVSRQLAAWRDAGLIGLGRGRIVIRDPAALEAAALGG